MSSCATASIRFGPAYGRQPTTCRPRPTAYGPQPTLSRVNPPTDESSRRRRGATVFICLTALLAGCAGRATPPPTSKHGPTMSKSAQTFSVTAAVVRYQVADVERSVTFYTGQLEFEVEHRSGPVFASLRRGDLRLLLGGPGSSGSRPMPDGRRQEPGGWNRIVLYVDDLTSRMDALRQGGVRFRNDVESGPGGKQILVEDPDGNPIELHENPR